MRKLVNYSILFVLSGLLVMLSGSCASQYDKTLKSNDYELKYKKANEYYAASKYQKAYTLYEQSAIYYRGTPQDDSLNFFLAKSYFKYGDVFSAEYYFKQFCAAFPRSVFTEEANFLLIVSLYDQTFRYELDQAPTYRALSTMNDFSYAYPKSTYLAECNKMREDLTQRLDEKQYEAAKLYYTIEDYKAAITALHASLKDFPETKYREDILYLLVISTYKYAEKSYHHKQKDRYQAMVDEYYNFVSEFPESRYRKDVEKMYADALAQTRKEESKNPAEGKITEN